MDIRNISNLQLVRLCAKEPNHHRAWEEFVNRFNEHITLTVLRTISTKGAYPPRLEEPTTRELVHDLVQDVYLHLLSHEAQALKRFQGQHEKSIYAYLTRIATSVVQDQVRQDQADKRAAPRVSWSELLGQESRLSKPPQSGPTTGDPSYTVHEQVVIQDLSDRLEHLLEGEQKQRDILIFMLHVFDGLTASEIASQEGFALATPGVESVLRRIKQKLREAMEAERKDQSD